MSDRNDMKVEDNPVEVQTEKSSSGKMDLLTTEDVDRMFLELPSQIRVVKQNKLTGLKRHVSAYLCVNASLSTVYVSYQTGTVRNIIKGDGNLFLLRASGSLCQSIKEMHDLLQSLGISGDELIIDERED